MTGPTDAKPSSFIERLNKRRAQVAAEARGEEAEQDASLPSQNTTLADNATDPGSGVGHEAGGEAGGEGEDQEAELSDAELLEKYELPDPETVEEEAGLNKFFEGDMPDRLRQMAMRRVWRLNPLFRFADEMVEYGEDYTDAATVIEGMQTAYQVGKGYLQKAKETLDSELGDADLIEGGDGSKKDGTKVADKEAADKQSEDEESADKDADQDAEGAQNEGQNDASTENNEASQNHVDEGGPDLGKTGNAGNGELSHTDETVKNSVKPELVQRDAEEDVVIQEVRPKRMVFSKPK